MTAPTTLASPTRTVRAFRPRLDRPSIMAAMLLFAPVVVLNLVWFTSLPGRTMMGDDLELLLQSRTPGGYASSFFDAFVQTGSDKFRPVVTVLLSVLTDLFGSSFTAYRNVNLTLQLVNVALVGLLTWRLSRRSWLAAATAMTLVTISRFNVYFVLQVYGLMEGLAVTFLLCMLLAVHRLYETGGLRPLAAANLCYLLAVFTHERFILLGGFLVVATLMTPALSRSRPRRLLWTAVPVGVAVSNIVVKSWVLGIDFSTGAGGEDLELNAGQVLIFVARAVMNILGFNTGPDYLAGRNVHSLGALGIWLGVVLLLPVCAIGLFVAVRWARTGADRRTAIRSWLFGMSLLLPLLLSASIAFRQEFRWLYAPYIALIAGVSWALGRLPPRTRLQVLASLAVLAGGLVVDTYYRRHVDNTYFFGGLRTADRVRAQILDAHQSKLASSTVFVVTHGDKVLEDWYLRGGRFFQVYGPPAGSDIRLVSSLEAARSAPSLRPRLLVFEVRAEKVVEVTDQLEHLLPGAGRLR